MCVVCGCSENPSTPSQRPSSGDRAATPARSASALAAASIPAEPPVHDTATGDLHYGAGKAGVSVPGMSPLRTIRLEADVLGANNRIAETNRRHFAAHGVRALNLVSSPGSGKTTLLCATIRALQQRAPGWPLAVIEGDQQTSLDAARIRATGAAAIQINTGKGCHLDAQMVADAFARLPLHGHGQHTHTHEHEHGPADPHPDQHPHSHSHSPQPRPQLHPQGAHGAAPALLLIENVGNLVCPALWDLGEAAKVVILSVTEGEDKPLKYPDLFAAAALMVINKTDLLPHLDFDVEHCIACARRVNPDIRVLQLSARTGQGMTEWLDWLLQRPADQPAAPTGLDADALELAALRSRVRALEAKLAERA